MNNKKNNKSFISVMISIVILITLIGLCFPGLLNNLKFGLDLQGGFEVLYQVESIDGKEVTSDMVTNTYKTMLKRIRTSKSRTARLGRYQRIQNKVSTDFGISLSN